jgi:hypothetical protein
MMLLPFTMQAKEVQIEGQNNYFTGSIDIIKLNGVNQSLYILLNSRITNLPLKF